MATYYFAWVDKSESTFSPTEHAVHDEDVFSFSIQHGEGEFPVMEVDLRNPRVGLLAPGRSQWAWLSRDGGATEGVVPLFFGRVLGVPQQLQEDIVRLTFVARPQDYEEQRTALAATLREHPYYDEAWLSEEARNDPDSVLEGRPALWHIDRTTHEVTISDIITGEDGTETFQSSEAFYDSVRVSHSQSPLRRVDVEATVQWGQRGSGTVDLTARLLNAFAASTPDEIQYIDNTKAVSEGVLCLAGGDEFAERWPQTGQSVGGGWTVGEGYANIIGNRPMMPIGLGPFEVAGFIKEELGSVQTNGPAYRYVFNMFKNSPGFITAVHKFRPQTFMSAVAANVDLYWVPIWRIAPRLVMQWEVERGRTEVVTFSVSADVQSLLSDPDDEETAKLTFGPVNVDSYIWDSRSPRYFSTGRGASSFEYLLARARTLLLARSRAVNVEFEIPFEDGLDLSLRKNATLFDPRLPGGQATGKITNYTLALDGDSGEATCSLTIACCVGKDGTITVVDGDPLYVEEGYVESGYQAYDNDVIVPFASDLGYGGLQAYAIDDDGRNLFGVGHNFVEELTVTGGLIGQMDGIAAEIDGNNLTPHPLVDAFTGPLDTMRDLADSINSVNTNVRIVMTPVTGGPFETNITPTVTELKIPKTIDLETT